MSKSINVSMSEKDLEKIDVYCTMHEITRSKFLVQCALEKVYVADLADGILLLNQVLTKANKECALSDEDRNMLETVSKLVNGGLNGK